MSTTTQTAGAGRSALAWTDHDETNGSAWPPATRGELGTLPLARLRRVMDHIREHLDQDLTLAQLGAVVYMSPYHFARLFQRSTGVPPHRFVVRTRIDRAVTLLTDPELSIAQISRVVGFRTPSHFSTVFRRITSATPRAYRARYLETGRPEGNEMRAIEAVMQLDTAPCDLYPKTLDPDMVLVERLRRQEEGAAEALVAAYGDRVYRLAMRITGNGSDAEEVVQDALWAAMRKIDTFRGTAAFGSWIYRITANAACQKPRRRRNEVAWDDVAPSFDEAGHHVEPGLDWSPRLKDPVLQTELRSVLSAAIDELPEEFRATFLLHDVEGLSSPEVAETLQVKLATVKSRVHRARLFLRTRMAEYMSETPALN